MSASRDLNGSSPLTRGTRIEITSFNVHNRFIPAYAGNSCKAQFRFRTNRGSSPLTRGTPRPLQINLRPHRFIPAYAGNSLISRASVIDSAVHPRLRGELFKLSDNLAWCFGSSPLTRGTRLSASFSYNSCRFIPAYAGNSAPKRLLLFRLSVHPRLRGELLPEGEFVLYFSGSSPLTRGTLTSSCFSMVILRFIPAYAGNSMELMTLTKVCSVHPRLRGELKGNKVALPRENGSSPLTRGTHSRKKTDTWSSPVHPRLRGELGNTGWFG